MPIFFLEEEAEGGGGLHSQGAFGCRERGAEGRVGGVKVVCGPMGRFCVRFRRVVVRKNETKRPSSLFEAEDYSVHEAIELTA